MYLIEKGINMWKGVFIVYYIKISNNLQFLALATVYGHLATVYYLLQKRAPTVNQIVQNGCLQFISFLGHYFTPGQGRCLRIQAFQIVFVWEAYHYQIHSIRLGGVTSPPKFVKYVEKFVTEL